MSHTIENSTQDSFQQTNKPSISVVVPVFNEQDTVGIFINRIEPILSALGMTWEIIFIDDGSSDRTLEILLGMKRSHPQIQVISLSRNFGKEIALTAGLDNAQGSEAIIVIDVDLQDPPELIPLLIAEWRRGFDVVYATRRSRSGESWWRRATAAAFYRLMENVSDNIRIPRDTGDFRLLSRRATDALLHLREHHRFMKGLFAWIGFPSTSVLYDRGMRLAGGSKWSFWKLWNLSLEGITSFSLLPLKLASFFGFVTAIGSFLYGLFLLLKTLLFGNPVPGYPSLIVIILFMGSIQLIALGIVGEYIGRIFVETKNRPLYIIQMSTIERSTIQRQDGKLVQ